MTFLLVFLFIIIFAVKKIKEVKHVLAFEPLVKEIVPNDVFKQQLILSIILTESKGLGTDIMQSSESMSLKQNQVLTSKESIQFGVKHFNEMDDYRKKLGLDLWSSVQAYNFGAGYLTYLKEKGDQKYSLESAEEYSKELLAPQLGNQEGKTYRYFHLHSILYNGGSLYQNGGNFFYAKIVKWNLEWIKGYQKIEKLLKN